jgi:outer membrane receptor protein involved in Fe transport
MNAAHTSNRLARRRRAATFTLACLPCVAPAWASASTESTPLVLISAHYDNGLGLHDSAGAGRVNADLVQNRPLLRPGELLELVPGMIVTQHSSDAKANQYYLRGFNLDHGTDFATWVEGMPVNMRSHAHGQGYTDLNFLIPELVQRIDYKKGPYFAEEGDFASAGAARLRLADRLASDLAQVTLGEDGYRRALVAGHALNHRLLIALEANRNDGPWLLPERLYKRNAVLRYGDRAGNFSWHATVMAYRNRWNASDQLPQRAVNTGLLDRFGAFDPTDGGSTARTSLSLSLRHARGERSTEADAYAVRSRLNLFSNFTYALDRPDTLDQFEQAERRTMSGPQAVHKWQGAIGGAGARHQVGVELRHDELDPVGLYHNQARSRIATVSEDAIRQTSLALYGETQIEWQPHLRTIAALRYDRYRASVLSQAAGSARDGTRDARLSPKVSLIFGPWKRTEFYVNAGRGFHSNDARAARSGAPLLAAAFGAEAGLRRELRPGVQSALSLWRLDLDSELVYVGDAGVTEIGRGSRRTGVEWSHHAVLAPWLLFDLDLAWSRARYRSLDSAGQHVPGALERMASVGVTVPKWGRWSGNLNLRYVGPRALAEDGSVRSSATALLNGRIGYQLPHGLQLTLDAFNLADRRASDIEYFYRSRLPGEAAEGKDDIHAHPVAPRTVRLTLAWRF